ncbi:MAG: peptidyl-prolyl cis-trans isomerase, partial [candidate division Zixibacteria bacterium]|nr:peptidyl-prolyl cis-trans isomerase [candidate division Zixibacteria bacterium]
EVTHDNYDSLLAAYDFGGEQSRRITRHGSIPGIAASKELIEWLFTAPAWTFSSVYDTDNDFRIFRTDGVTPAGVSPLEDVYSGVERTRRVEKQKQLALEKTGKVYDRLVAGDAFADACAAEKVQTKESAFFARTGRIPGMGQDPNFIGIAFTLSDARKFSKPIMTQAGAVVMEYRDRLAAKLEGFEAEKDSLQLKAASGLRSAYWDRWFNELIRKSEIIDYRQELFGEKM